jgi:S1-C subfamily serine protease
LRIGVAFRRPPPIPVGTSHDLKVGQRVFAIGNPFGLDWTLTTGIVSALNRSLRSESGSGAVEHLIQTDAAINPGNSGGPLLDSSGRLIGMNTAIYSPSGASAGIGFAVPVDTITAVVPQLIRAN